MGDKILLFGGSFDPIHLGHLVIARYAAEEISADKVIFVPSYQTPLKEGLLNAKPEYRYEMVKLATEDIPTFEFSDFELSLKRTVYTHETLKYFKQKFPDSTLYFLIGQDSALKIATWRESEEIFRLANIVCASRPIDMDGEIDERIEFLDTPLIEISSTEIRNRLKSGRTVDFILPDKVREYIIKNKIYS